MYLDQNGAISMKKNAETDEKTRNRFIVFIINGINDEYLGNRSLFWVWKSPYVGIAESAWLTF